MNKKILVTEVLYQIHMPMSYPKLRQYFCCYSHIDEKTIKPNKIQPIQEEQQVLHPKYLLQLQHLQLLMQH
ncbi:hypothetical protein EDM55_12080 [Brevibacillus centrosporus]|nr:hypothetical protein EDM55_12080 [Brevibacillus centrosporus]